MIAKRLSNTFQPASGTLGTISSILLIFYVLDSVEVGMSKTEAADGLHGVQFRVFFDLEVIDGEQTMDQLRASLKQKILVKGYGGEYRGAQAKFWFDILEDENYSGMGNVIAYIAEVFMKVDKRTELSLPDLHEFIRSEKCRVLYNVIEQGETLNDKIGKI